MQVVFFIYGLAFMLLGVVLGLQARSPIKALPARTLWLMVGFSVTHGVAEWLQLLELEDAGDRGLRLLLLALLVGSFGLLLAFGVNTLRELSGWPRWTRLLPLVPIAAPIAAFLASESTGGPSFRLAELAARYALGFPGSLLAAAAFMQLGRRSRGHWPRRRPFFLYAAATAFLVYAVAAGLVAPAMGFFPASLANTEAFRALGFPIEVVRTACALAIAVSLAEIFVLEAGQVQQQAERQREEFVAVVAHDLRNVANSIGLSAQLLMRQPSSTQVRAKAEQIFDGTKILSRMICDLLDASLVAARDLPLDRRVLHLGSLATRVAESTAPLTAGREVVVRSSGADDEVLADPVRLQQVLLNLLSNADKYSEPGSPISVSVSSDERGVTTSVTNRGAGLGPDELQRLFGRFYRATGARSSGVPGLGLGLYIARGIIEAHSGRIWATSEPGKETTFAFWLPLAARARDDVAGEAKSRPAQPADDLRASPLS